MAPFVRLVRCLELASVDWLSVAIRIRLPLCECLALFSKSCRYSSAFNRVIASALKLHVLIPMSTCLCVSIALPTILRACWYNEKPHAAMPSFSEASVNISISNLAYVLDSSLTV